MSRCCTHTLMHKHEQIHTCYTTTSTQTRFNFLLLVFFTFFSLLISCVPAFANAPLPVTVAAAAADDSKQTTAAQTDSITVKPLKQILFLNSYSQDFITVPIVMKRVEEELKDIATIQYVFMNTKNRPLDFAFEQTKRDLEYLQEKHYHFDVILTGDDDAFDFVQQYREQYFAGIPVVFEDINSEDKARTAMQHDPLLAGVVETFPIRETLDLALKIQPQIKQIIIVSDNSVSAQGTNGQLFAAARAYPQLKFQALISNDYSTEALAQKIHSYGDDTLLWFGVFSIDGSGKHYSVQEGARFISTVAKIPLYKADEAGIGDGVLGGCVLSYESIGHKTANMIRAILQNGVSPAALGYISGDFEYMFDRTLLDHFKISKSKLPPETYGAIFKNEEPSFYEQHSSVVWSFTGLILIIVIIGLMNDRKRNQHFNERLTSQKAEIKAAELANIAKTDFLSRMSHDIRTPLNAIIGLADLAKDDVNNPEKMQDNLRKIHNSGEILLGLLNDVLDVSRIESGKLNLQLAPFNLDELVANLHVMFDDICDRRGLQFNITSNVNGKMVLTDKVRFTQIIANLLNNAAKFTPAGGKITFTATCDDLQDGLLPCTFVVADTGIGMSPEFQHKMFEAFTQENIASAAEKGSGLGLAIVKKITDLMGGTITVQSAPSKGTTFTLKFNFKPVTISASDVLKQQEQDLAILQGRRILLVEDNPLNALIATRLLKKQGILVEQAENGQSAVDKFSVSELYYYDAILMDIRMPVMNGREATLAIRGMMRGDALTIPIIAMTADAFDGDVKASLKNGMNAHLNKPIEPAELYRTLAKYMHK